MRNAFMYILLGGVLLVLSCSKNGCTLIPSYAEGQENHQEERLGISPMSLRITPKEAAIVACIERFGTTVKMNRIEGEVESVDSICNSLGRALCTWYNIPIIKDIQLFLQLRITIPYWLM
ncbi:MAG: hypothetical protein IKV28_05880 [Bacteroidales bacterium]|nr:hypothetical protein [Bacteroidales bacterium]